MFGGSGKGGFVRTQISTTERTLSWLLVGLIGATGLAIWQAGQSYDESLFGLDPASLASVQTTARDGREAANTIVVPSPYSMAPVAAPASARAPGPAGALAALNLPGWRALGEVEEFTPGTLYEKINGRAEQYISYDVVSLTYRGLVTEDGALFLDLYVYDMGTPERAFGIYSVERDPTAERSDLGRRGYVSGASLFLWHGTYYVQVLASDTGDALRASARTVTERLLAMLPDRGAPAPGLDALPRQDMVPNSEKYYAKNALGFGFLTRTWSADYRLDGAEVTLFLSTQADDAGADEVLAGYRGYLTDFGATITEGEGPDGGTALFGDMDGYYDVLLRRGTSVAGAALLEDRALAERVAADLLPRMVAPAAAAEATIVDEEDDDG